MTIKTIDQAFAEIEKEEGKTQEAITFLHAQEKNEKITEKLKDSLNNAYKEGVYPYPVPLYYAIVAENHLSEELLQPIIDLCTKERRTSDFLNEQASFLTGKICDELGEKVVTQILEVILADSLQDDNGSTLFLFDCLYYIEKEKHLPIVFKILENENYIWLDSFAVHLGNAQIVETLGRLKEIRDAHKPEGMQSKFFLTEIDEVIQELEEGKNMYPDLSVPYFKQRKNWKNHYMFEKPEPVAKTIAQTKKAKPPVKMVQTQKVKPPTKKVGRNEPCPCGSGKKYKKCCLNK